MITSTFKLPTSSQEDKYALRRILVGRLQRACRGVSRRTRFQRHRSFIEEWSAYERLGRQDLLWRAVTVGPAVGAEVGETWRDSFLLRLAAAGPLGVISSRSVDGGVETSRSRNLIKVLGKTRVCEVDLNSARADSNHQGNLFQQVTPRALAV